MSREVTIGIVGAKFAGEFHADCWARVPGTRIAAVADLDEAARSRLQATYRIPRAYATYAELIADRNPCWHGYMSNAGFVVTRDGAEWLGRPQKDIVLVK